ncbi:MAG TPA: slipin family protein [Actinomycetes bacterium]|nr:slipin family protein [Actinomycetes bacterium]
MGGIVALVVVVLVVGLVVAAAATMVKVLQEYERGVIFRLGRVLPRAKGPGMIWLLPFGIDRMRKVSLQVVAMNVPPQDVITKDNVTMRVDAVVYSRVVAPVPAVVEIQNYLFATSQAAQTHLRAILGRYDLDTLLGQRDQINLELRATIARITEPWGVEVGSVEVKDIDLPVDLRRAMAHEAEAERDARALQISGEAELRVSQTLAEAAGIMSQHPQSMQLRFLQTVAEVATERNSTLVMPIPIELLSLFGRLGGGDAGNGRPPQRPPRPLEGPDDERRGGGNGRPG